ncbi:MAG: ribonuclease M5 [Bacilli bacterium]
MKKLKEIIVVEGKDDTVAIKRSLDADTIETNGSAVSKETIEQIRHAQTVRGVIIFTDPDYPGEKIRKTITRAVEGCKHAFLQPDECRKKGSRKVGIEYATSETIRIALENVYTVYESSSVDIDMDDLLALELVLFPESKQRRERLTKELAIGHANGKQLLKRLQMFHITREALYDVVERWHEEDK